VPTESVVPYILLKVNILSNIQSVGKNLKFRSPSNRSIAIITCCGNNRLKYFRLTTNWANTTKPIIARNKNFKNIYEENRTVITVVNTYVPIVPILE